MIRSTKRLCTFNMMEGVPMLKYGPGASHSVSACACTCPRFKRQTSLFAEFARVKLEA